MQNRLDYHTVFFIWKKKNIYMYMLCIEFYIYIHNLPDFVSGTVKSQNSRKKLIIYLFSKNPALTRHYLFILSLHERIFPNELL